MADEKKTTVELSDKELKRLKKASRPFWKKKRFIFPVAVIAIIVIASASHSGGSSSAPATASASSGQAKTTSSSSTSSSASASSTSSVFKVGQTVKIGEWQYVVHSVHTSKTVGDSNAGLDKKANGIFYVVNVSVTNLDKSASTIDDALFKLKQGGNEYSADTEADIYANNDNTFFLQQVNPNVTMTGNLVFDVPASLTKGVQLEVSGGITQGGSDLIQLN